MTIVPKSINKVAIDELRRSYDIVGRSVDKLLTKTLTFIAATFALLTYLYNGGNLFIPPQVYGRIFYFVGVSLVITAIVIFLLGLKPRTYKLTTSIARLKDIKEKTEEEYLEYVKNEYIDSLSINSNIYEGKHRDFSLGFVFLVIGAFVLIIIKTFPGNISTCYTSNATTCNVATSKKGEAL